MAEQCDKDRHRKRHKERENLDKNEKKNEAKNLESDSSIRLSKLPSRTSKLRVQNMMSTIVEETLPNEEKHFKLEQKKKAPETDPSATSHDIPSITLNSSTCCNDEKLKNYFNVFEDKSIRRKKIVNKRKDPSLDLRKTHSNSEIGKKNFMVYSVHTNNQNRGRQKSDISSSSESRLHRLTKDQKYDLEEKPSEVSLVRVRRPSILSCIISDVINDRKMKKSKEQTKNDGDTKEEKPHKNLEPRKSKSKVKKVISSKAIREDLSSLERIKKLSNKNDSSGVSLERGDSKNLDSYEKIYKRKNYTKNSDIIKKATDKKKEKKRPASSESVVKKSPRKKRENSFLKLKQTFLQMAANNKKKFNKNIDLEKVAKVIKDFKYNRFKHIEGINELEKMKIKDGTDLKRDKSPKELKTSRDKKYDLKKSRDDKKALSPKERNKKLINLRQIISSLEGNLDKSSELLTKPKLSLTRKDLGSLDIPPFKPKSVESEIVEEKVVLTVNNENIKICADKSTPVEEKPLEEDNLFTMCRTTPLFTTSTSTWTSYPLRSINQYPSFIKTDNKKNEDEYSLLSFRPSFENWLSASRFSLLSETSINVIPDSKTNQHYDAAFFNNQNFLESLYFKPQLDYASLSRDPYCYMALNNLSKELITQGTNTEITWSKDEKRQERRFKKIRFTSKIPTRKLLRQNNCRGKQKSDNKVKKISVDVQTEPEITINSECSLSSGNSTSTNLLKSKIPRKIKSPNKLEEPTIEISKLLQSINTPSTIFEEENSKSSNVEKGEVVEPINERKSHKVFSKSVECAKDKSTKIVVKTKSETIDTKAQIVKNLDFVKSFEPNKPKIISLDTTQDIDIKKYFSKNLEHNFAGENYTVFCVTDGFDENNPNDGDKPKKTLSVLTIQESNISITCDKNKKTESTHSLSLQVVIPKKIPENKSNKKRSNFKSKLPRPISHKSKNVENSVEKSLSFPIEVDLKQLVSAHVKEADVNDASIEVANNSDDSRHDITSLITEHCEPNEILNFLHDAFSFQNKPKFKITNYITTFSYPDEKITEDKSDEISKQENLEDQPDLITKSIEMAKMYIKNSAKKSEDNSNVSKLIFEDVEKFEKSQTYYINILYYNSYIIMKEVDKSNRNSENPQKHTRRERAFDNYERRRTIFEENLEKLERSNDIFEDGEKSDRRKTIFEKNVDRLKLRKPKISKTKIEVLEDEGLGYDIEDGYFEFEEAPVEPVLTDIEDLELFVHTPVIKGKLGLSWYAFKSELRYYRNEERILKMLAPCIRGKLIKAPKLTSELLINPRPALGNVPSQECELEKEEIEKYKVSSTLEFPPPLEDIEEGPEEEEDMGEIDTAAMTQKEIKKLQYKKLYMYEILHPDEVGDKCDEILPPIEKKDIAIQTDDIPIEKKDIGIEKKDIPVEKKDVAVEKKDIPIEKKDIDIETDSCEGSEVCSCPSESSTESCDCVDCNCDVNYGGDKQLEICESKLSEGGCSYCSKCSCTSISEDESDELSIAQEKVSLFVKIRNKLLNRRKMVKVKSLQSFHSSSFDCEVDENCCRHCDEVEDEEIFEEIDDEMYEIFGDCDDDSKSVEMYEEVFELFKNDDDDTRSFFSHYMELSKSKFEDLQLDFEDVKSSLTKFGQNLFKIEEPHFFDNQTDDLKIIKKGQSITSNITTLGNSASSKKPQTLESGASEKTNERDVKKNKSNKSLKKSNTDNSSTKISSLINESNLDDQLTLSKITNLTTDTDTAFNDFDLLIKSTKAGKELVIKFPDKMFRLPPPFKGKTGQLDLGEFYSKLGSNPTFVRKIYTAFDEDSSEFDEFMELIVESTVKYSDGIIKLDSSKIIDLESIFRAQQKREARKKLESSEKNGSKLKTMHYNKNFSVNNVNFITNPLIDEQISSAKKNKVLSCPTIVQVCENPKISEFDKKEKKVQKVTFDDVLEEIEDLIRLEMEYGNKKKFVGDDVEEFKEHEVKIIDDFKEPKIVDDLFQNSVYDEISFDDCKINVTDDTKIKKSAPKYSQQKHDLKPKYEETFNFSDEQIIKSTTIKRHSESCKNYFGDECERKHQDQKYTVCNCPYEEVYVKHPPLLWGLAKGLFEKRNGAKLEPKRKSKYFSRRFEKPKCPSEELFVNTKPYVEDRKMRRYYYENNYRYRAPPNEDSDEEESIRDDNEIRKLKCAKCYKKIPKDKKLEAQRRYKKDEVVKIKKELSNFTEQLEKMIDGIPGSFDKMSSPMIDEECRWKCYKTPAPIDDKERSSIYVDKTPINGNERRSSYNDKTPITGNERRSINTDKNLAPTTDYERRSINTDRTIEPRNDNERRSINTDKNLPSRTDYERRSINTDKNLAPTTDYERRSINTDRTIEPRNDNERRSVNIDKTIAPRTDDERRSRYSTNTRSSINGNERRSYIDKIPITDNERRYSYSNNTRSSINGNERRSSYIDKIPVTDNERRYRIRSSINDNERRSSYFDKIPETDNERRSRYSTNTRSSIGGNERRSSYIDKIPETDKERRSINTDKMTSVTNDNQRRFSDINTTSLPTTENTRNSVSNKTTTDNDGKEVKVRDIGVNITSKEFNNETNIYRIQQNSSFGGSKNFRTYTGNNFVNPNTKTSKLTSFLKRRPKIIESRLGKNILIQTTQSNGFFVPLSAINKNKLIQTTQSDDVQGFINEQALKPLIYDLRDTDYLAGSSRNSGGKKPSITFNMKQMDNNKKPSFMQNLSRSIFGMKTRENTSDTKSVHTISTSVNKVDKSSLYSEVESKVTTSKSCHEKTKVPPDKPAKSAKRKKFSFFRSKEEVVENKFRNVKINTMQSMRNDFIYKVVVHTMNAAIQTDSPIKKSVGKDRSFSESSKQSSRVISSPTHSKHQSSQYSRHSHSQDNSKNKFENSRSVVTSKQIASPMTFGKSEHRGGSKGCKTNNGCKSNNDCRTSGCKSKSFVDKSKNKLHEILSGHGHDHSKSSKSQDDNEELKEKLKKLSKESIETIKSLSQLFETKSKSDPSIKPQAGSNRDLTIKEITDVPNDIVADKIKCKICSKNRLNQKLPLLMTIKMGPNYQNKCEEKLKKSAPTKISPQNSFKSKDRMLVELKKNNPNKYEEDSGVVYADVETKESPIIVKSGEYTVINTVANLSQKKVRPERLEQNSRKSNDQNIVKITSVNVGNKFEEGFRNSSQLKREDFYKSQENKRNYSNSGEASNNSNSGLNRRPSRVACFITEQNMRDVEKSDVNKVKSNLTDDRKRIALQALKKQNVKRADLNTKYMNNVRNFATKKDFLMNIALTKGGLSWSSLNDDEEKKSSRKEVLLNEVASILKIGKEKLGNQKETSSKRKEILLDEIITILEQDKSKISNEICCKKNYHDITRNVTPILKEFQNDDNKTTLFYSNNEKSNATLPNKKSSEVLTNSSKEVLDEVIAILENLPRNSKSNDGNSSSYHNLKEVLLDEIIKTIEDLQNSKQNLDESSSELLSTILENSEVKSGDYKSRLYSHKIRKEITDILESFIDETQKSSNNIKKVSSPKKSLKYKVKSRMRKIFKKIIKANGKPKKVVVEEISSDKIEVPKTNVEHSSLEQLGRCTDDQVETTNKLVYSERTINSEIPSIKSFETPIVDTKYITNCSTNPIETPKDLSNYNIQDDKIKIDENLFRMQWSQPNYGAGSSKASEINLEHDDSSLKLFRKKLREERMFESNDEKPIKESDNFVSREDFCGFFFKNSWVTRK